jgi:hypothetical protein
LGAGLFRRLSDANLLRTVPPTRLKSSFIYLANAVSDLRGNWMQLTAVLAPMLLLGALCLVPEALNLQSWLASNFSTGVHTVSLRQIQEPYPYVAAPAAGQPFALLTIYVLSAAGLLIGLAASLVVLCQLQRFQQGARAPTVIAETVEVYRRAIKLAPGFYWVLLLQYTLPVAAIAIVKLHFTVSDPVVWSIVSMLQLGLLVLATALWLWLYFAPFALVLDGQHSFHALLFSRDLMRKRFFTVAVRIFVFAAVAWGYNSCTSLGFAVASAMIGPVAVLTGLRLTTLMVLFLLALVVGFATMAFFITAGARLYQDLCAIQAESRTAPAPPPAQPPTMELNAVGG